MKLKNKKILIIAILAVVIIAFIVKNITFTNDFFATNGDFQVTISIECATVLNNYDMLDPSLKDTKYVPKDGVILKDTSVWVNEGESVLDVLKKVTAENGIQMEYTQSPNDSYVEGINYLYEFSCGELSGWMYTVNDVFASVGCNSYILSDGDDIDWVYTCNLGEDVGEKF